MKTTTKLAIAAILAAAMAFGSRYGDGDDPMGDRTASDPTTSVSPTAWSGTSPDPDPTPSRTTPDTAASATTRTDVATATATASARATTGATASREPSTATPTHDARPGRTTDRVESPAGAPIRVATTRGDGGAPGGLVHTQGTIGLNDAGCWVMQHPDDEHVLVWPAATDVIRDGEAFDLDGYGTVDSGDLIAVDAWAQTAEDYDPGIVKDCRVSGTDEVLRVSRVTGVQRF